MCTFAFRLDAVAKLRISEDNTKQKNVFFAIFFDKSTYFWSFM